MAWFDNGWIFPVTHLIGRGCPQTPRQLQYMQRAGIISHSQQMLFGRHL